MDENRRKMRDVLVHGGFDPTDAWIEFAIQNGFKYVPSTRLVACPDCAAPESRPFGRFVYYSHLINVRQCEDCDLLFTDLRLDPATIARHFEQAYKDEVYFSIQRAPIFDDLAEQVERLAPAGGRVLDIGGANGHLMSRVRDRRPDLRITVNDLSSVAVANAARTFGFETLLGGIKEVRDSGQIFDVVVASDVLYYEPDLATFWATMSTAVAPGGAVVLRVPNKLFWIRVGRIIDRGLAAVRSSALETRLRFLNPEHLYILSRSYLKHRFEVNGFDTPAFLPSPLLRRGYLGLLPDGWFAIAGWIARCTGGRLIATPGMVAIARRAVGDASTAEGSGGRERLVVPRASEGTDR